MGQDESAPKRKNNILICTRKLIIYISIENVIYMKTSFNKTNTDRVIIASVIITPRTSGILQSSVITT
jgi:hypothetical protein